MGRASSKVDLMTTSQDNFEKLNTLIGSMTEKELTTPFDFADDDKKKEAHWRRDKNLRDILIHLYEWHQLLLKWVSSNQKGQAAPFLPEPYNWRTYGEMNIEFWKRHQETPLEEATKLYQESHKNVMELAESFTNQELFTKDVFPWVGGSTLGSYFVSATASHYDWAMKKLRAHIKKCK
ncbi:ClbS/DfsB family four-helix bundle protein [Granulicatella seriolae]|uniref:ClbS/DfsB family four-helix bundle protein n=1 Tax=Granulicatella seriolae TaxID=2967226 RepID=A0ABT1WNZ1_9LACT|nr:ClbS/DfsB family four-helix bundle protein [Granulicatella seriolae]